MILVSWADRDHAILSTLVHNRMLHSSQDTVRDLTHGRVEVRVVQVYQVHFSAYHSSTNSLTMYLVLSYCHQIPLVFIDRCSNDETLCLSFLC